MQQYIEQKWEFDDDDDECISQNEGNNKKNPVKIQKNHDLQDFKKITRCHFCLSVMSMKDLKIHINDMHERSKKVVDKQFLARNNIEYFCDFCDITFSKENVFKNHIANVHEGLEKQKCKYCRNKVFKTPRDFQIHEKIVHDGGNIKKPVSKEYKCDFCSKAYSSFSGLKYHLKTSHEGKNFQISHDTQICK